MNFLFLLQEVNTNSEDLRTQSTPSCLPPYLSPPLYMDIFDLSIRGDNIFKQLFSIENFGWGCPNRKWGLKIFENFHEIFTSLNITVQNTMSFLLFKFASGIHFLDLLPNRINILCRWIWVNLVGFRF